VLPSQVNVSAGWLSFGKGNKGGSMSSFVYSSTAPKDAPKPQQGKSTYFTTFSFQGKVTVYVTDLSQQIVASSCKVRPSALNIACTHPDPQNDPYTVALAIDSNAMLKNHISVEFGLPSAFSPQNQLMIFGEPPEEARPEATNHTTKEGTVIYYPPGLYDLGETQLKLFDGTTLYIAGGAYLYGGITTPPGTNKVTIRGRGIVSGERWSHPSTATDALALFNLCGNEMVIDGVTAVNAPSYVFQINAFWDTGCGPNAGSGTQTARTNMIFNANPALRAIHYWPLHRLSPSLHLLLIVPPSLSRRDRTQREGHGLALHERRRIRRQGRADRGLVLQGQRRRHQDFPVEHAREAMHCMAAR
jgi:hypothetical protein